jgi:membrane fusion protein (multidrug efflux system)
MEVLVAESGDPQQPARAWLRSRRVVVAVGLLGFLLLVLLVWWIGYRLSHSITDDAFIESDMIELAPRVEGQIAEMLVDDSQPITRGQLLARIDPVPYQQKVAQAQAALKVAEADHATAVAALERLEAQVPQQIAAAAHQLEVARNQSKSAGHILAQSRATFEHDVRLAEQGLQASQANLEFARVTAERWNALVEDRAVAPEERDAKQTSLANATAQHAQANTRLAQAKSDLARVKSAEALALAAEQRGREAQAQLAIAQQGPLEIAEARRKVEAAAERIEAMRAALALQQTQLGYTDVVAPFDGVVAKRFKFRGDFGTPGVPIFSLYDTENLYVTAHLEETKLEGVGSGHPVDVSVDAFSQSFKGRVLWVGKATGAQFALIPRNLSTGEFTKVIQRVPVRVALEKDDRWSNLRPGLSATVAISHSGPKGEANAQLPAQTRADVPTPPARSE